MLSFISKVNKKLTSSPARLQTEYCHLIFKGSPCILCLARHMLNTTSQTHRHRTLNAHTTKELFMTSQTHTLNTRHKHSIARFFGILFIFSALITSALTVIWPRGSSAANSTITLAPDADTYVRQSTADSAYATSSQFSTVGGSDTRIAFLRFTV